MKNLIAVSKYKNWQNGAITIWFEDNSTNDGEIYGVVFEGNNDAVLVDANGVELEGYATVLAALIEAARVAVVNL